jgi:hypothetical protein
VASKNNILNSSSTINSDEKTIKLSEDKIKISQDTYKKQDDCLQHEKIQKKQNVQDPEVGSENKVNQQSNVSMDSYADPNYDSDANCVDLNFDSDDNYQDPNYDSADNEDLVRDTRK